MNATKIIAPVMVGAAINIVHAVPRGHAAVVRSAIGNAALAVVLAGVAEVNDEFGIALAVTYAGGSLLVNGAGFVDWFSTVFGTAASPVPAVTQVPSPQVTAPATMNVTSGSTPSYWKPQTSTQGFGGSF